MLISIRENQYVSLDCSYNCGATDKKMAKSVSDKKSLFEILGFSFSLKLDWVSHAVSTGKTVSKKIGVMIHSTKCIIKQL